MDIIVVDEELLTDGTNGLEIDDSLEEGAPTPAKRGRRTKLHWTESYKKHNPSDIVDFISRVQEEPVLWDSSEANHHRVEVKRKLWMDLEDEFKRFMAKWPKSAGKTAENLWKELEKDYSAHLLRIRKAKSGCGKDEVQSKFSFSDQMSFLNGPLAKRETKNVFIVGSEKHELFESMNTPKADRKVKQDYRSSSGKENVISVMREEMEKNRETLREVFAFENDKKSECSSRRVCEVFKDLVKEMSELEKYDAEADVVSYMRKLRKPKPPASSPFPSYHSRESTLYDLNGKYNVDGFDGGASTSNNYSRESTLYDLNGNQYNVDGFDGGESTSNNYSY